MINSSLLPLPQAIPFDADHFRNLFDDISTPTPSIYKQTISTLTFSKMIPSVPSFPAADPDPGAFHFNDYVFHMLSAVGAAAFYAGTARFGLPIFSTRILQLISTPFQGLPDSSSGGELRLKSPIVTTFDGRPIHWVRWKTRTSTTFISTGYGRIIDGTYDASDPLMIEKASSVFAWLIEATTEGSAYWLVSQHRPNMDGYSAWQSLCA